ncbi:hypothetical protein CIPAW_08G182900 [Carya illinoinensis]|uniref:Uncharacterized protein n=1 Tax=Carya illinoinensis TaxID=32201 RepID=A0A8T1PP86_CARIL|nr:hypothetical protein CIPAW_08G182900 [Carya illinoinensis]
MGYINLCGCPSLSSVVFNLSQNLSKGGKKQKNGEGLEGRGGRDGSNLLVFMESNSSTWFQKSKFIVSQIIRRCWTDYTRSTNCEKKLKSSWLSNENIPADSDVPPPWAQDEGKESASQQIFEIPFYVYLLASAVTAIAAIGSVFEYVNLRPVFGILKSDSIFYAPLLGFFAFTGIPVSIFLWLKSVQAANKEAEEQDRRDGYL